MVDHAAQQRSVRGMNEDTGAVVRLFVEEFQGNGTRRVGEELLAADFVNRTPDPGSSGDRQAVLDQFEMLHTGLSDLRVEIHQLLVSGDRAATHKTFHGTHTGDLMGVPASGRALALEVMDIVRVRDGQIVEHWNVVNQLAFLRQLSPRSIAGAVGRRLLRGLRRARPR